MQRLVFKTEQRKINDLIPYTKNPRQLTDEQKAHLHASLEKFGLVEIPVIDTDNTIVAGHMRLRMMQELGHGEEIIDVRVPDRKLTQEEFDEYNIRSNKNTGQFDYDMLSNCFDVDDLKAWGFTDSEMGFFPQDDIENQGELDKAKLIELVEIVKKIKKRSEQEHQNPLDVLKELEVHFYDNNL